MNKIIKLFLQWFLLYGLLFGVFKIIIEFFIGREFHLWSFLISALGFGLITSILRVTHFRYKEKDVEKEKVLVN